MEVMELFTALESNHSQEVEEVKHKFHEQFNNSKYLLGFNLFLKRYLQFHLYNTIIVINSAGTMVIKRNI